jgi:hypothetical protein
MKLRIRKNSLRLRLQQHEVQQLVATGAVTDETCFGDATLRCTIETSTSISAPCAHLASNTIRIRVPTSAAVQWSQSNQVGILAEQSTPAGPLLILIEKDFACLQPRDPALREDDSDAFDNPHSSCGP